MANMNNRNIYNEYQLEEIIKCRDSVVYFAENYIKIPSIIDESGIGSFYADNIHKGCLQFIQDEQLGIILSSRQTGKTTKECVYSLWEAMFHENKTIGIISNKLSTGYLKLARMKEMYDLLPDWLKVDVMYSNKEKFGFINGSNIKCMSTAISTRGQTFNTIFVDECAYFKDSQFQDIMYTIFPIVSASTNSKLFLITSAGDRGTEFHKFYLDCINDPESKWATFKILYNSIPHRGKDWVEMMKEQLGKDGFDREFLCEFINR